MTRMVQFSRASAFHAREPHDADAAARVKALLQSTGTSVMGALRELAGASAEHKALAANIASVGKAAEPTSLIGSLTSELK